METNCPNCGAVVEPAESRCPYCGTAYPRPKRQKVAYAIATVPEAQEDPHTLAQEVQRLMAAGILTANEARAHMGLPPR